jgi:hypothetical protein
MHIVTLTGFYRSSPDASDHGRSAAFLGAREVGVRLIYELNGIDPSIFTAAENERTKELVERLREQSELELRQQEEKHHG